MLTPPSLTWSGLEGLLIMSPILHLELPSLSLVYFLLPMYSQSAIVRASHVWALLHTHMHIQICLYSTAAVKT